MNITICNTGIRQDAQGRYCLNDLHKAAVASGANERTKEPGKFMASPQTVELVKELETTQNLGGFPVNKIEGRNGGTYAVKSLAIRYAMWISPSVLDSFIKQIEDMDSVIKALNDFEVPDDLPDMFVYAIRNKDTGNLKIGISRNPESRLKQLQIGCDGILELVSIRPAENRYADEKRLHNENKEHRIHGEWFTEEAVV